MDLYVKNILTEWNFFNYVDAFIEQEINQESFECLDDETIKLLFPKAGPRAIFKKKWTALKELEFSCTEIKVPNLSNNQNQDTYDPLVNDETGVLTMEVVAETITDPFEKIDNADISMKLCNPIINLIECLRDSTMGVAVLSFYRKNRSLNDNYRNLLCDTILHVELRSNTDLQISSERFKELSQLIVEVFCTEKTEIYYIPYQYDKLTKTKVFPKGKLYQRYSHHRGILLESKIIVSTRGVKRKILHKSLVYLGFYDNFYGQEATDELEEQIDYLQDNIDSWETIEEYWKNTSAIRLKRLIEDEATTSTDYINSFPILLHKVHALTLINIDFESQYRTKTRQLHQELNSFKKEIYNFCKSKKRPDKEIKELIFHLESTKKKEDENTVEIIIFRLLPLLLPCPPAIYLPGKEPYRPKKLNVQEEFLFHAKNEEELNTFLNKRKANCTLYGLSEQPLSAIVGETFESIVKYYLIINNIKYEASSIRDVIDFNFKSCFSFQLAFSKIALYPWLVLQQRIYDIQGETDEVRPAVSTFITTLKSNG